jgi:hypothetical protein
MRQGWLGTSPSRNCSAGCDAQIKIMQHLSVSRVPLPPACNLGSMLRGYFSVVSIKVEEGRDAFTLQASGQEKPKLKLVSVI